MHTLKIQSGIREPVLIFTLFKLCILNPVSFEKINKLHRLHYFKVILPVYRINVRALILHKQ